MKTKRRSRARVIALGTVVGVILAVGGSVSVAGAAPSSIKTCTKLSTGKTKVISASAVAKCTAKGKGVARNWDDHAVVGPLQATATKACNEASAEDVYLHANELPTWNGVAAYFISHPSIGAAQAALCSAAPSSIKTCTKISTNKTKVIAASAIAKCIAKGKGVAQTFDDHAVAGTLPARVATACSETDAEIQYLIHNDPATLPGLATYLVDHDSAFDAAVALCGLDSLNWLGG